MVELKENLNFTEDPVNLHPLCLPSMPSPVDSHASYFANYVGYGTVFAADDDLSENHLRQGDVTIYGQRECREAYDNTKSAEVGNFLTKYLPGQLEQNIIKRDSELLSGFQIR